jgi:hypothetical protein
MKMQDTMNEEVMMTLAEFATFVRLAKRPLYRAIRRGTLKATNVGGRAGFRILKSDGLAWVREGMKGTEPFNDEERTKLGLVISKDDNNEAALDSDEDSAEGESEE